MVRIAPPEQTLLSPAWRWTLGPMRRRQRMEALFALLRPQPRGRSFLRGWTFPQEQSATCSPGMNLGVGRLSPGSELPGWALRYQANSAFPTAGSRREALNKSRKMGHVYSFTDQPRAWLPTGLVSMATGGLWCSHLASL